MESYWQPNHLFEDEQQRSIQQPAQCRPMGCKSSLISLLFPTLFSHLPQGYTANRNRTLNHLYLNNIPNTAFLAGDSHANWVSDLVWLDETPYDQVSGEGAIGVEFAGTAVSSSGYGAGRSIANSSDRSAGLVRDNRELQWAEGYYRGYYELHISPGELNARYFGESKLMCCLSMLTLSRIPVSRYAQPIRNQSSKFHCEGGCKPSSEERSKRFG